MLIDFGWVDDIHSFIGQGVGGEEHILEYSDDGVVPLDRPYFEVTMKLENKEAKKFRVSFDPESGLPTIYTDEPYAKTLSLSIHEYICDLLHQPFHKEVRIESGRFYKFPTTTSVKNFVFYSSTDIEAREFSEIFENLHVESSVAISCGVNGDAAESIKKILKIKNIVSHVYRFLRGEDLLDFKGENAFFRMATFSDMDLNRFLKKWCNGDEKRTQTMIITLCHSPFGENVVDGIATKKWDPEQRARRYDYSSP
ncbi:hypothetical protein GCK72_004610 [Caenorhabditis remanei]|uniref:Sdz-33 F-box domain-containing protein n=1 Tax=Caenorhabditis remanei TaxID=31234 RepID=A0A6A5HCL7_CAERE|nr:hypothetical protein GCK72_004610 [Caenorhabditis remanei]KAF1764661.1 hypothetical protein GCK72_004610 [Caenorhabditis remanei]